MELMVAVGHLEQTRKPPNAALQRRAILRNLRFKLLLTKASTESAASACSARRSWNRAPFDNSHTNDLAQPQNNFVLVIPIEPVMAQRI
jgi:hypothetical protein